MKFDVVALEMIIQKKPIKCNNFFESEGILLRVTNQDVRKEVASSGLRLWQIAEALGIADYNFSRKLRRELPAEEKEKIFGIIRELSKEV